MLEREARWNALARGEKSDRDRSNRAANGTCLISGIGKLPISFSAGVYLVRESQKFELPLPISSALNLPDDRKYHRYTGLLGACAFATRKNLRLPPLLFAQARSQFLASARDHR